MSFVPGDLSPEALDFLTVRHLATLPTLRPDGTPHVTPVGFTWDADTATARIITSRGSRKTRNATACRPAALCQVDGRWWLSLEGATRVLDDAESVRDAERRYAARYREPRHNPQRVVIAISVTSILG